jgi:integrase
MMESTFMIEGRTGTPYLHNNLEQRWLTPRLQAMGIDERGMGFHAFRRFSKTWLRGERCQEDINNFWMGHQPDTMPELYSRMEFETDRRLEEAAKVGVGFTVPTVEVAPSAPRISEEVELELRLQEQ